MEQHGKTQEGLPLTFRIPFAVAAALAFFVLLLWYAAEHGSPWFPLVCLGLPMLGLAVVLGMDLAKWRESRKASSQAGQEGAPPSSERA